jgi:hypothetical protein
MLQVPGQGIMNQGPGLLEIGIAIFVVMAVLYIGYRVLAKAD